MDQTNGNADLAVDQVVWVKIGQENEETGKIVSLGERHDDQLLVHLIISGYKVYCARDQLRSMDDESSVVQGRSSRRLTTARSVVTPSPKMEMAVSIRRGGQQKIERKPATSKIEGKPAAKRKSKKMAAASSHGTTLENSSDAANAPSSPYFNKRSRKSTPADSDDAQTKSSARKVRAAAEIEDNLGSIDNDLDEDTKPSSKISLVFQQDEPQEEGNSGESSGGDNEDEGRPFQVDYAPTSRAVCRRCDERILKGTSRVSHVPLFRGKPGFRVYRHLQCAVFSEDINKAEDVGGWKKLADFDYECLVMRIEESKVEAEEENAALEPDELVQAVFQGETREPASGLDAKLLPFQVQGISWMYHQEVKVPEIRGGILADEMGMGKTLQTIGTMLDNRPILQHSKPNAKHPPSSRDLDKRRAEEKMWAQSVKDWKHEMEMNKVPKKVWPKKGGCARAGTLVVCPLIALTQWKTEIEKFTKPSTFTVGTYHGPNRAKEMPAELISKYDIILTTYQVLEQDFRKMVSPNKVTCPNCSGKFKVDKLRVHLKYFCGAAAKRTEAQSRQRRSREDGPGNGSSGRQKKATKKKGPSMTKQKQKVAKTKTKLHVKKVKGFDTDSDLSIEEEGNLPVKKTPTGRPSRSAAKSATKKMSASLKEWGTKRMGVPGIKTFNSGDDSSFASRNISSSEDSSSEDERPSKVRRTVSAKAKNALRQATEKQAQALASAKKNSKKGKKQEGKGKGKSKKKRFDTDGDSRSDVSEDVDPMAGIDLEALVAEAMAGSKVSILHTFSWWRIVLDEAHFIKSRSSQTAASAFALTSIHRWCLSGTPLQNRVGELYSLIRFLRIDPMAHYFCRQKDCNCKSIHYRMDNAKCVGCGHASTMHYAHFNRHVLGPIQRDGYSGDGRRAMFKLKNEVLDKCLLRRTKETQAEDMQLPPRIVTIRSVRLHPIEEDFYEALYTQTKSSFDDYVAEGTLLNNYAHIFDLLTKMRQAVDHPYLIVHSKRSSIQQMGQKAAAVANGSTDCAMCHEPPTSRILSSCCQSGFCRSCVIEYLSGAGGQNTSCPGCEAPFTIDLNQANSDIVDDGTLAVPSSEDGGTSLSNDGVPSLKQMSHVTTGSILRRINLAEFATSSKIEVLVQELILMRKKRPGSKALVFSQFVNMLDLVRWRLFSDPCLVDLGLGVRILHGGMDVKSRDAALKDFREDSSCRVLLMSLKAAGVALNLTVASECYLLDLWWNPAAEMQAIDRCHRLGQYRPIRAVRFVAKGTVEERVLQLQEKKRLVFDGTVGRDAGSLKMLTGDDMKALFT